MKKLLFLIFTVLISTTAIFAQVTMVGNNSQTVNACGDSFGLGSYTPGTTYVVTVCSDDAFNNHVFVTGSPSFPPGTQLCVYDGTSTSDPLLVCWDNTTTSGTVGAYAQNTNSSGCLTFELSAPVAGASFNGTLACQFVCPAPIILEVSSTDPPLVNDGGVDYVNVCWDEYNNQSEDVTFTATGNYPPVTGYTLNDANVTFTWEFNDGTPDQTGVGLNTVTHNFPARQGYTVIVTIEDSQGCVNTNSVTQRVRVSRAPIWNTTTTSLSTDSICMGEPITMCGYYTSATWNTSVVPFVSDTDTTSLPDGNGVCYENNLMQNQFLPDQTLESINDLNAICMCLEHSYLGDLTIDIQCPSGQSITLQTQGGGGTHLGEPIDNGYSDNNTVPGVGYWYCMTPTASQTMTQASSSVSTLPAGNYASAESMTGLVGCTLNGLWTITICDNWGSDDGYIFGWYIDFDQSLYPGIWSYTPIYTPISWEGLYGSEMDSPTNQNCATGTYITTGTPNVSSDQHFIFTITDDLGCEHDTAMYVTVYQQLTTGINDTTFCTNETYTLEANLGYNSYDWSTGSTSSQQELTYSTTGIEYIYVTLTNDNCTGVDTIVVDVDVCDQINSLSSENIIIFPVPANTYISIQLPNNQQITELNIYNMQGELVRSETSNSGSRCTVPVHNLPSGQYVIYIKTNVKTYTGGFVIQ